jgi:hypothetical protein
MFEHLECVTVASKRNRRDQETLDFKMSAGRFFWYICYEILLLYVLCGQTSVLAASSIFECGFDLQI